MNELELDALSLEYQRDYGAARSNLEFPDFVNNPFVNCEVSILSLGLFEKFGNLLLGEIRVSGDDISHSSLVA